jgi:hypothetical protein
MPHVFSLFLIPSRRFRIRASSPPPTSPAPTEASKYRCVSARREWCASLARQRPLPLSGRGGGDRVKPACQFLHDKNRPREPIAVARSETNGGLRSDRCNFSLSPIHSKKRFTRSIIPTAESPVNHPRRRRSEARCARPPATHKLAPPHVAPRNPQRLKVTSHLIRT